MKPKYSNEKGKIINENKNNLLLCVIMAEIRLNCDLLNRRQAKGRNSF